MITIKEYARQNNVSYEAIRSQIKRYEKDLKEHIHKEGRTRFIDDFAVSFLDERRKANPVIVQEDNAKQIEAEAKYTALLADTERKDIRLREAEEILSETKITLSKAEKDMESMQSDLQEAKTELESYQKTIFGLYKKVK